MVDDDRPIGDVLDIGNVVTGEQDRRRPLVVESNQQFPEDALAGEVESDRRLVEEQHLRLVQQARSEFAAHPLPEREGADRLVEQVGGLEQFTEVADPVHRLGIVDAEDRGEHAERGHRRQFGPEL